MPAILSQVNGKLNWISTVCESLNDFGFMSYSRRSRYSSSPSPYRRYGRSVSRSRSRSRSRSCDSSDVDNPGNNLYVTGLSTRVTKRDLEKHFSTEGKVEDVHLVVDPWTRESRGFGFVTMSTLEEANRCIKYLDRTVLEGRVITVEKARRRRGRTPTPGKYLGLRTVRGRRYSHSYSPRSRSISPRSRSISPRYSSERHRNSSRSRSRSYSPYYTSRGRRSYSPYGRRRRSYSPVDSRGRSYSRSRSRSYSGSPVSRRYYYYDSPERRYRRRREDYSPDKRHYRRSRHRSMTPPRYRWQRSRRSYSRSVSSGRSRSWSYSSPRRDHSRSVSPFARIGGSHGSTRKRSGSRGPSRDGRSSRSHSRSPSASSLSRSMSAGRYSSP